MLTKNQTKLCEVLLLLSDDKIEEQALFEQLSKCAFQFYNVKFISLNDLSMDYPAHYEIVSKKYNYEISDFFFDAANCKAYKKIIPKLIEELTL
jgi:hypothetical protein